MPRTRVRWKVLFYLCLLAGVTYLDRICISMAAPSIRKDLGLSESQMGWVFSAFTLAYGIFEMPTGAWGDRVGTRTVLTRIVVWWSVFTMATAGAWSFASLVVLRFMFGIGEAGAWPNAARSLSRWFPIQERATAQGIFFVGAHLSGGLTQPLVAQLLTVMHWRQLFFVFGFVGLAWALAWYRWFRNEPQEHPETNLEEQQWIMQGRPPAAPHRFDWSFVGRMFSSRNMLLLCLAYFTQTFAFYFFITWLPQYLSGIRGFSGSTLAWLSGLPLLMSVITDLIGGITTDAAIRRWGLRWGRSIVGALSFAAGALAMFIAISTTNPWLSAICIGFASAATTFPLGAFWSTCTQLGGSYAGLSGGMMNTAGQVGGFLCPIMIGYAREYWGADWTVSLYTIAGLFALGSLSWLFINVTRTLDGHAVELES